MIEEGWLEAVAITHRGAAVSSIIAMSDALRNADREIIALRAEVAALRCLLADEGYQVGAYAGCGIPLFARPAVSATACRHEEAVKDVRGTGMDCLCECGTLVTMLTVPPVQPSVTDK